MRNETEKKNCSKNQNGKKGCNRPDDNSVKNGKEPHDL